jgi:hypothetical protein
MTDRSSNDANYGNWELALDRANSARRALQAGWRALRSNDAAQGRCRPASAREEQSNRPVERQDFDPRKKSGRPDAGFEGRRSGRWAN